MRGVQRRPEFASGDPELDLEIAKLTFRFIWDSAIGPTQDFGDSYGRWEMGRESGWATAGYGILALGSVVSDALDGVGVGEVGGAASAGYRFEEKVRKAYRLEKATFRTNDGARRFVDGFEKFTKTIYESKSGKYITLSDKSVKLQIEMDIKLVAEGKADRAVWIFKKGTRLSKGVLKALEEGNIGIQFLVE